MNLELSYGGRIKLAKSDVYDLMEKGKCHKLDKPKKSRCAQKELKNAQFHQERSGCVNVCVCFWHVEHN